MKNQSREKAALTRDIKRLDDLVERVNYCIAQGWKEYFGEEIHTYLSDIKNERDTVIAQREQMERVTA